MTSRLFVLSLFAAAVSLGACGKQGDLERPAPLFGAKAREAYAKEQALKDKKGPDGNGTPNASGENNAGDATDVVAPAPDTAQTTPLPQRTAPIPGSGPDPFSSGPQGALPNPYADPNRSR
jgi:predicted small lipoprotein YifL